MRDKSHGADSVLFDRIFGSGRFTTLTIQDASKSLAIGASFALLEKPLGFHRGDFLCRCDHQELIQARPVTLADLFKVRLSSRLVDGGEM